MTKRNYGIDVLRITAMFFVVVLHNLGQGGVLAHVTVNSWDWWGTHLLENLALVAVNVFAMITGYLGMGRSPKSQRVIGVLLQTVFWAFCSTGIFLLVGYRFNVTQLIHYLIPIFGFWYVKAYLGLMLLSPLLSAACRNLSKTTYARLVVALLLVSLTLGWFNLFYLLGGYSAYWLIVMYLVGGYFKLFPTSQRRALS